MVTFDEWEHGFGLPHFVGCTCGMYVCMYVCMMMGIGRGRERREHVSKQPSICGYCCL